MFFVLFAFWLLLNGRWSWEIGLVGAVLSGLLYAFMCRFMGFSPQRDLAFFRRIPRFAGYLCYLVGEMLRSGRRTMRLIWSPRRKPEPQLLSVHSGLKTRTARVLYGNSITLTPGTITVDIQEDQLLVHALDAAFCEDMEHSEMLRRVSALEGGERRG